MTQMAGAVLPLASGPNLATTNAPNRFNRSKYRLPCLSRHRTTMTWFMLYGREPEVNVGIEKAMDGARKWLERRAAKTAGSSTPNVRDLRPACD